MRWWIQITKSEQNIKCWNNSNVFYFFFSLLWILNKIYDYFSESKTTRLNILSYRNQSKNEEMHSRWRNFSLRQNCVWISFMKKLVAKHMGKAISKHFIIYLLRKRIFHEPSRGISIHTFVPLIWCGDILPFAGFLIQNSFIFFFYVLDWNLLSEINDFKKCPGLLYVDGCVCAVYVTWIVCK